MFKKFRKKPIEVDALQFTQEMQNDLIALGIKPRENHISVTIPEITDAETEWNWFTQQLYLHNSEGQMQVNVNDWIIKEPFDKVIKYYPIKNDILPKTYEEVTDNK